MNSSSRKHSRDFQTLVRYEGEVPRERSTCGWRERLISREDVVGIPDIADDDLFFPLETEDEL